MPYDTNLRRRRSQRVILSIPITVSDAQSEHRLTVERTHTLAVSRFGGLIALQMSVDPGRKLLMTNTVSRVSKECRVVYLGPHHQGAWQVGIEFLDPSADFWHISFPAPQGKRQSARA